MAGLVVAAAALTVANLDAALPGGPIVPALLHPDPLRFAETYLHYALLPRALVALLAGAALGFSGVVFQQVLRNPLAEPSTLGVLSGAQLCITVAALSVTALPAFGREVAGLAGGLGTLAIVLLLATRQGLSVVALLLCGMVISFTASAASVILGLLNQEYLRGVFIWASGSLLQNDYGNARALAVRLLVLCPLLALMIRPLVAAGTDDRTVRSLGMSPGLVRAVALGLATALAVATVARVGVIAFVGLAAPHLARLAGARTLPKRLLLAPVVGAALLLLADGIVQWAARSLAIGGITDVPAGVFTALCGAVFLIAMLLTRSVQAAERPQDGWHGASRRRAWWKPCLVAAVLLLVAAVFSLRETLFVPGVPAEELLAGRWPRLLTAGAAGVLLALSGSMIQAMTGNPLASPEGLGVSAGAAVGMIGGLFVPLPLAGMTPLLGGIAGALVAFAIVLAVSARLGFAPGPTLLAGISVGMFATALISLVIASGHPRSSYVLAWAMGPTFRATAPTAAMIALVALGVLAAFPLATRWLTVLPLGTATTRALGMRPGLARVALMMVAALGTAAATLAIGPISFVGLMAPHMARAAGAVRPLGHGLTAASFGALLLVGADWVGRSIHFPYEIPAGVLVSFLGGPYFLWLLHRSGSQ